MKGAREKMQTALTDKADALQSFLVYEEQLT